MSEEESEKQSCRELEEISNDGYNLTIYGVKKSLSSRKLKCLIERKFGSIDVIECIPYIKWNIANINCSSKETYSSLINFNTDFAAFSTVYKIHPNASHNNIFSFSSRDTSILRKLNLDCWRQICLACPIKTQIHLAKVSQTLLDIIRDIWFCSYRHKFSYDLYEFEFKHELTSEELQDFLIICGHFAEKVYFNTIFYFPLIQRHFEGVGGNLLQHAKKFINVNFCRNLAHLSNMRVLEVHGKFLADFTIKELARYCKNLNTLQLLDTDTRWLRGKYVPLLSNLQVLSLQDCEHLSAKQMLRICSALSNLKTLNIVHCKQLQDADFIVKMCGRTSLLQVLKISATASEVALDAILATLPHLRVLKFYWLNNFAKFESLYFAKLLQHKRLELLSLSFSTDKTNIENSSKTVMSPHKYALMRENTTINGCAWQLCAAETSEEIKTILTQFSALHVLKCIYCRPFEQELLLELAENCTNLKEIKLIGCRTENDESMLRLWQQLDYSRDKATCKICIEGLIPLTVLKHLRQHASNLPFRTERNYAPVLRSIKINS